MVDRQISNFGTDEANRLHELLTSRRVASQEKAGAISLALMDISESVNQIYSELLPKIMEGLDIEANRLEDALWEIRDEFRHIDYHIHDAQLTDQ